MSKPRINLSRTVSHDQCSSTSLKPPITLSGGCQHRS